MLAFDTWNNTRSLFLDENERVRDFDVLLRKMKKEGELVSVHGKWQS